MAQIGMPKAFWPKAEIQVIEEYIAATRNEPNKVVANNTIFIVERVIASYSLSGSYGLAPRILFYFLILVAVLWRKSFLITVALGSVMVYSSGAALHAIVLASLTSRMVPRSSLENYGSVQVDPGRTVPIIPGVIEGDTDAVFAIVGSTFLALTPMQVWSSTFKKAEQKAILVLWTVFLFVGFFCACLTSSYVYYWSFPQLRFCPIHTNDTLPMTTSGSSVFGGTWDHIDRNHWNDTVTIFFENTTIPRSSVCFYPSLDYRWPLRDPSKIVITSDSDLINTWMGFWMLSALWFVVSLSATSSLVVVWTRGPGRNLYNEEESYRIQLGNLKSAIRTRPRFSMQTTRATGTAILRLLIHIAYTYAKYLSGVALIMYVVFAELLLKYDPPGESFKHVGQWEPVAATVLVFVAVLVDKKIMEIWRNRGRHFIL
jgi:hypothetical protein